MTVAELIKELENAPGDANVRVFQQSELRSEGVSHVDLCGTKLPENEQMFYICGDGKHIDTPIE